MIKNALKFQFFLFLYIIFSTQVFAQKSVKNTVEKSISEKAVKEKAQTVKSLNDKTITEKDLLPKNVAVTKTNLDSIPQNINENDSIVATPKYKFKKYKKGVHASYYANKFNGKRTSSGKRFDNNKYTAAHRKFPFGTKLRITNEANGKSVIVEVLDRGPFSRGREIDLTKRAFLEITDGRNGGSALVTIEEIID